MKSSEMAATLILTSIVGLMGVVLDMMLGSFYFPRTLFLGVGLSYLVVAFSVFRAMSRPHVNLSLGLFVIAIGGAGIFIYIWLNAFLGRPAWFREYFISVFVFFVTIKSIGVAQHVITIGHTRQRGMLYIGLVLACLAISAVVNLFGQPPAT